MLDFMMKQLPEESLDCGCLTLDACAVVLERRQNVTGAGYA
jgi:hypothetical protein